MYSYWEENYWLRNVDIAIIGSGIVGVNSAIQLKKKFPGKKIVILERGILPTGASTKNAGFACFGTVGEILDDLKYQDEESVIDNISLRWEGLQWLKTNVLGSAMDYQNLGGSEVFVDKMEFEYCESKLKYVNALIESAIGEKEVIKIHTQSFAHGFYKSTLFNHLESQLNPMMMMYNMLSQAALLGIEIHNNIAVERYNDLGKEVKLFLKNGINICASKVIICTNAFTNDIVSDQDIVPARNQVFVTEPIDNLPIMGTFHYDRGYIYFRNIKNRILIGGARNIDSNEESTSEFGENPKIFDHLCQLIKDKIGIRSFKIEKKWSGIIATGKSKVPIIKEISQNVYLAARLGGMGVAIGSKVAQDVTNLVEFQ